MTRRLLVFCFLQLIAVSVFATGNSDRRTVALLDLTQRNNETTDGELYSAQHILKVSGIPFVITTNVDTAMRYGMIVTSSRLQATTLIQSERDSLYSYVYHGGTLLTPIVTDPAMYNLFGITGVQSSTTHYTMTFDTLAANSECRWINDTAEVQISLGRASYINVITTRSYSTLAGSPIAAYDDSSTAIVRHTYGTGKAYALGFSFKSLVQTNQLNLDYDAQRVYSNGFEPTSDALILFVKGIYTMHTNYSVWLHTSPYDSKTALLLTHDVDATTAYDTMGNYADYENSIGVRATYLITTHYINDDWLSDFYNPSSIPKVQYLLTKGHRLASHSVGHFPDFDTFPLGTQGNTTVTYQPYYPTGGPTAGGSMYGEAEVSKHLLETDFGVTIRTFRSGYLLYQSQMINALDSLGYVYNTTNAAPDVLTNFPFRGRYNQNSSGQLSSRVWEFPMVISDVFSSDPISASNYPQKVATWLDVIRRNKENYAPNVLLIHPTRMFKLAAEMSLVNQLPSGVFISDLETFADYWRGRDSVRFTSELHTDTLVITIPSTQLPLDSMISFIVDDGQLLALVTAQDENGNPVGVVQSPWEDNDLILHFGTSPIITSTPLTENKTFNLSVYPNPAADEATIEFGLEKSSRVQVDVLDLSGRTVLQAFSGLREPGRQHVSVNSSALAAGTYFCRVQAEGRSAVCKLVVIR